MARLPALIDALSKDKPRTRPAVEHMARVVREAGLIKTTKRGRGAAEMTEADAIALLIGRYGAETPGDAPDAVKLFSELPNVKVDSLPIDHPIPSVLSALFRAKTFGRALEAILVCLPELKALAQNSKLDRSLVARSSEDIIMRGPPKRNELVLHVMFIVTHATAMITIGWGGSTFVNTKQLQLFYSARGNKMDAEFFDAINRDHNVRVTIGREIFERLHGVLWTDT